MITLDQFFVLLVWTWWVPCTRQGTLIHNWILQATLLNHEISSTLILIFTYLSRLLFDFLQEFLIFLNLSHLGLWFVFEAQNLSVLLLIRIKWWVLLWHLQLHMLWLSLVATIVILLSKQMRKGWRIVHLNRLGEVQLILLLLDFNHVFQILHVSESGFSLVLVAFELLNILIYSLVWSFQLLLILALHHQFLRLERLYLRVKLLLVLIMDLAFLRGEFSLADSPEVFGGLNVIFFKLPVLLLSMRTLKLRYFPLVLRFGHHVA